MYMKDWIAKLSTISSLSGTFGIPTWQSRYPKMPKEPSIPSLPITQMTEKYIAAKIKDDKIWNRRPAYNSRYIPVKIRSNEQIIRN
ncbi:MAG: hypothetical protein KJ607_14435, partial [Bacteroidetes bacterium]|nr:hypothetical protein [Bacteroidota bacterium]